MNRMSTSARLGIGVALLAVGVGLVAFVALKGATPVQNDDVNSHGQPLATVRTVLVSGVQPADISRAGQPLQTVLVAGTMPSQPSMATVMSDENCAPDSQGVSHCTNRLRLDDGSQMTVMHPHRMAEVPCLAPGERISLRAA